MHSENWSLCLDFMLVDFFSRYSTVSSKIATDRLLM